MIMEENNFCVPLFPSEIPSELRFKRSTPLSTIDFKEENNIDYIAGMFPVGRLTMLIGDGSVGKSYICILASLTITSGKEFLPIDSYVITDKEKVLIIETESRIKLFCKRIIESGGNIDNYAVPGEAFYNLEFSSIEDRKIIEDCIKIDNPKLVIVDGFAGFSSVDENTSAVMPCLKWLAYIAEKYNTAVVITHFINKGELQQGKLYSKSVRGFTGLFQYPQLIWAIDIPNVNKDIVKRLYQIKNNIEQKDKVDYIFKLDNNTAELLDNQEFKSKKDKRIELLNNNKNKDIKELVNLLIELEPNTKRDTLYRFVRNYTEKTEGNR